MQPLVFEPHLRAMVWGGRKLAELFSKPLPPEGMIGESWEISPHRHHVSQILEGPHAGMKLNELCARMPTELYGDFPPNSQDFPLLIKLLDCRELLSIQVHPTDQLARKLAGETFGKTEAWVILHVEPDAKVYAGFLPDVTRREVEQRIAEGTLESALHGFTPKPGDCLFLPAGTVHAVGGGVVMAEVQQASDATFRLYDWNRPGPDGNPRQLHVEQALESINWSMGPVDPVTPKPLSSEVNTTAQEQLVQCPYFEMRRATINSGVHAEANNRLVIWMLLDGDAMLRTDDGYQRHCVQGETVLVPASSSKISWENDDRSRGVTLLRVSW